jgi:hypothetical protein
MQYSADDFEKHSGCRLLFATMLDGAGKYGPFREGQISEVSPSRVYVLIAYNPTYGLISTDTGNIVRASIESYNKFAWFKIEAVDVIDIWEKPV